jgi:hypothetical protein
MQECEVLCSKLVIMTRGVIQCIGSAQYIKEKYCQELNITVKCKRLASGESGAVGTDEDTEAGPSNDVALLEDFIIKNVPNSLVRDRQQETLFIQIDNREHCLNYKNRQTISDLFFILDSIKYRFNIETFSISEPTLEQVFFLLTQHTNNNNFNAN